MSNYEESADDFKVIPDPLTKKDLDEDFKVIPDPLTKKDLDE